MSAAARALLVLAVAAPSACVPTDLDALSNGECGDERMLCMTGDEPRCVAQTAEKFGCSSGDQIAPAGWRVTASDISSPESQYEEAIDGNHASRWASGVNQYAGMWFMVDTQEPTRFLTIQLDPSDWPLDTPGAVYLFLSDEPPTFDAPALRAGRADPMVFAFSSTQEARYMRFEIAQPTPERWWSISEVRVLK